MHVTICMMEYLNIVAHFQGTYEALDGEIGVANFNYIKSSFCMTTCNCLVTKYKSKKTPKQRGTLTRTICRAQAGLKDNEAILNLN